MLNAGVRASLASVNTVGVARFYSIFRPRESSIYCCIYCRPTKSVAGGCNGEAAATGCALGAFCATAPGLQRGSCRGIGPERRRAQLVAGCARGQRGLTRHRGRGAPVLAINLDALSQGTVRCGVSLFCVASVWYPIPTMWVGERYAIICCCSSHYYSGYLLHTLPGYHHVDLHFTHNCKCKCVTK